MIRTTVGSIRIAGRNTQGVMIFRVDPSEHVVSVAKIDEVEEEVDAISEIETAPDDGASTGEQELDKPVDPGVREE
jgi:DNA gyrase subunit A